MCLSKSLPHRRSMRLLEFDYSQPGTYFVTIVTQDRNPMFGQIVAGEMVLNEIGKMVSEVWDELPEFYQGVSVDIFVIMPNHVHGLIILDDVVATPRGCPDKQADGAGQARGPAPTVDGGEVMPAPPDHRLSLPDIVHRIKSLTTHRYSIGVRQAGWVPFNTRLWQRNYYEHVIRNERDYQAIFDYILANPLNWEKDGEHVG